jgi:glycosyltransferase involved in cell wall biosynthesis
LDSIPQREDLQVIVMDDNSETEMLDIADFPGITRPNTEVIFLKGDKGKGPGYARNEGLSRVKGKWILFSDADDYFNDSLNDALDQYRDREEEIIFFKCSKQDELGEVTDNYALINDAIENARKSGNTDSIVYNVPCPWGKFIKRDFLFENRIKFQEITCGDDILFSIRMAIKLKSFTLSDYHLYCVVDRPGSLTRNNHWQCFYSYVQACCEAYRILKSVQKEKLAAGWISAWWGFLWSENRIAALSLVPQILVTLGIKDATPCLKKGFKQGAWDWRANTHNYHE